MELLLAIGIPSAVFSAALGFIVRSIQKRLDRQEKSQVEREKNQQDLYLMMMQSTRSNAVGIVAIANAIKRIPDAHCNGDMEEALRVMKKHQEEEKDFLMKQGIKQTFSA